MARIAYRSLIAGDFRLLFAEPKAGDSIPAFCETPIPAGQYSAVTIVLLGAMHFAKHPPGFNAVVLRPGMSSDDFGARPTGKYELAALEDSKFVCVSPAGRKTAPFIRRKVVLSPGDPFVLEVGSMAVMVSGSVERIGALLLAPHILASTIRAMRITAVADVEMFLFKLQNKREASHGQ